MMFPVVLLGGHFARKNGLWDALFLFSGLTLKRFSVELHFFSVDLCVAVYFTDFQKVKNENHRGVDRKSQYHSVSSFLA